MFQYLFKTLTPSNPASEQSRLTNLPPELLLNIATFCGTSRNVAALVRTCRWTHQVLDNFLYVVKFQDKLRCCDCDNDSDCYLGYLMRCCKLDSDSDRCLGYPMRWAVVKPERLPTMVKWYKYIAAAEHETQHGSVSSGPSAKQSTMAAILTMAVRAGNDAAADWLLDHGAFTEDPNDTGWTLLMTALENKNVRLAKRLIEHGADVSAGMLFAAPCIKLACQIGDCAAEVVDMILERGAENYPGSPWKFTPLDTGAVNATVCAGSVRLLQLFIDRGVDVTGHLRHERIMADMPAAMSAQQCEALVFLLKRGYYPAWDSEDGRYLLEEFCMGGKPDYLRCFFEHTALTPETRHPRYGSMLHCNLEMHGSILVTKLLIDQGADVNSRGRDNETALARAIKLFTYPKSRNDRLDLLLAAGADVNRCFDAVELAISPRFYQCLPALIRAGADLSRTITARGRRTTLLIHAISEKSDFSVIRMILETSPDTLGAESDDGRVALEYAITSGHVGAVCVLLAHGASVQRRTKQGLSMLSLAAQSSERKCMAVLIRQGGANVNARDESDDGWYPLMHAVQAGDVRVVLYLLDRGADTSLRDHHGRDVEELLRGPNIDVDLKQAFYVRKTEGVRGMLRRRTARLIEELSKYYVGFIVLAITVLLQLVFINELHRQIPDTMRLFHT